jgi:hypothetical protein
MTKKYSVEFSIRNIAYKKLVWMDGWMCEMINVYKIWQWMASCNAHWAGQGSDSAAWHARDLTNPHGPLVIYCFEKRRLKFVNMWKSASQKQIMSLRQQKLKWFLCKPNAIIKQMACFWLAFGIPSVLLFTFPISCNSFPCYTFSEIFNLNIMHIHQWKTNLKWLIHKGRAILSLIENPSGVWVCNWWNF